jgi:type I restriction enzyme R subunit
VSHALQRTQIVEYDQDQTVLDKQHFANFASKYADLCRATRKATKKKSLGAG